MENMSKALIMAGSVLISIIIIGALIFMFGGLSDLKQTEQDSETASKLLKYANLIEGYCKPGLYGSELVSLANLIDDYNEREPELEGYTKIGLEITINPISSAKYIKNNYKNYEQLIKDFDNLEKAIKSLKNEEICGQTLEKISGKRTLEIERIVREYNATHFGRDYTVEEVETKKDNYLTIKSEQTTFKNKRFEAPTVEQDKNTGRIKKMTFKEKGI